MLHHIEMYISLACIVLYIFAVLPLHWLIKGKRMREMEDILGDGQRMYSLNFTLAGLGGLHFGGFYCLRWTARRYGVEDKLAQVSTTTRCLFIAYFILFMLASIPFLYIATIHYMRDT